MMVDFVGGLSRPRTLPDIQEHFRRKGYDIVGNAVFDDDVLVGALQRDVRLGYTFLAFEEPESQQQVTRAIDVAREYGLHVMLDAERQYIVNKDGR